MASLRQVADVKKAVGVGKENDCSASAIRQELMRLPNSQQPDMLDNYIAKNTDDFIASESDRQAFLIKQQEEELEELSVSVQRIGGVGLTIHKELLAQEKILDELGTEMDSRKNQLDFVQRKMVINMNKVGVNGQIMIIIFLLVLFILVFFA
ncbi:syntaxin-61-like [Hibiscus syriacus]|uniref:syntaxin-61-like n=1 Tax=Hibiscus syriacus TaxID=106335 RepID=UPI00192460DD|nr:syntaxin-61-like [Hibiscus syriacus]